MFISLQRARVASASERLFSHRSQKSLEGVSGRGICFRSLLVCSFSPTTSCRFAIRDQQHDAPPSAAYSSFSPPFGDNNFSFLLTASSCVPPFVSLKNSFSVRFWGLWLMMLPRSHEKTKFVS